MVSYYGEDRCSNCQGEGKERCNYCYGSGQSSCSNCNGSGTKEESEYVYNVGSVWVRKQCNRCYGSGKEECRNCHHGKKNCGWCNGTGKQSGYRPTSSSAPSAGSSGCMVLMLGGLLCLLDLVARWLG
jgi:DnaJ-class molecular chaperone